MNTCVSDFTLSSGCTEFIDPLDNLTEAGDLKSNGVFIGTVNSGINRPWIYSDHVFQDTNNFGSLGGTEGFGRACTSFNTFAGLEYKAGNVDLDSFWLRQDPPFIRNITTDTGQPPNQTDILEMNESGYVLLRDGSPTAGLLYNSGAGTGVLLRGPANENAQVASLNDSQRVAGAIFDGVDSQYRACFWVPGSPTNPTSIHPHRGGETAQAASGIGSRKSINASGHVVGIAGDAGLGIGPQPFFYNGVTSTLLPGFTNADIADSVYLFVNDSNVISGTKNKDVIFSQGRAFKWDAVNGTVLLPLPLAATYAWVFGLNNSGIIVGSSDVGGWVYHDGIMDEVIDLLPTGHNWDSIDTVNFITDDNYIAGFGVQAGVSKGYVARLCF